MNLKTLREKFKKIVIGDELNPHDRSIFHRLSLVAFLAWVGLGADGLSSSCYGPEEAFLALGHHHYLSIFVAIGTVITIYVISACYSQIIEVFPTGGGGYLVASKLLSPTWGMISGCALFIDYVLTITISVASGADALFSFMPSTWADHKLAFAVAGVAALTVLNLRGIKESVIPLVPVFLVFLLTHVFAILYTFVTHLGNFTEVALKTAGEVQATRTEIGFFAMIILVLRAYSLGAGTYTGIEAVSNSIPLLREPKVETGKRTMKYMAASLSFMVLGLMLAYLFYSVHPVPGKTLNAVLFENISAAWGGYGQTFVLVTLLSEAAILLIAAQAGFLGGPRVLANMALDRWAPTRFAMLSDRFVSMNGIFIMGISAAILMILTGGSVRLLVVLYSINVFITFFLSQLGMVKHWLSQRKNVEKWKKRFLVSALGLILTAFILVSVTVLKFHEGGWVTLLVTGSLVGLSFFIKRHYNNTLQTLRRLEGLVVSTFGATFESNTPKDKRDTADPAAKTAVILVNGFNGLGLHTLFNVIRHFGDTFKNFVFIQVGIIDAGTFKGAAEVEKLEAQCKKDIDRYVDFMKRNGFYAEGHTSIAHDAVEEVAEIAPKILKKFPHSIIFGGQLVFPDDTFLSRFLHNYTVFAMQRKFYHQGIPVVILPIRV
ncbi:MAG: amino acid transporter [Elusimicrobia bacterium RIFCSPLOWO2_01_FULL_54_10]|nr:MAG: amino acid transporter [Elusimicrobia bacterium RIFCSPLOWO2_01_FULL_54_10]